MHNHNSRHGRQGQYPQTESSSYDTRSYYSGEGHGHRDSMPSGRGSYEAGDLETRWDHYNAAHYGSNSGRHESAGYYRDGIEDRSRYRNDDYRHGSGNREWHLNRDNHEGRNEYHQDRYNNPGRYASFADGRHIRTDGPDIFERVGAGVTSAWDRITGHGRQHSDNDNRRHRSSAHASDHNAGRSSYDQLGYNRQNYVGNTGPAGSHMQHAGSQYQNAKPDGYYERNTRYDSRYDNVDQLTRQPQSRGPIEENIRRYGNQDIRGYEKGHAFGDDTPARQHQSGYRTGNSGRSAW